MATQGPLSPSTVVNDTSSGGSENWVSPGNAASSNNAYASFFAGGGQRNMHYLKATGFGFSIPAGATILGITAEVERNTDNTVVDYKVRIVKGGTIGATDKADTLTVWPGADAYKTYGSGSDLWGQTWSVADINDSTFGLAFAADVSLSSTASVDHLRLTVTYSFAKSGSAAVAASGAVVATGTSRKATITGSGAVVVTGRGPDFGLRAYLGLPGLTEITPRLRRFRIRRGRAKPLDRMEAATASATFRNDDGAPLDPANVASPYFPNVRVLTELLLTRRKDTITYERFRGRVERIVPDLQPPNYQEQEIVASDAFEALAALKLESEKATLTTALAGTNNDLTFTAKEAGGRGDEITVAYVAAGNNTPLDGATNDPLQGAALFDENYGTLEAATGTLGQPEVHTAPTQLEVRGAEITITLATGAGGAITTTAAQVKAEVEGTPALAELVTVSIPAGNDGTGIVTAMAATDLTGGKWAQEKSGARINRALDEVGWPANMRRIDAGLFDVVAQGFSAKENVSALAHIQDCASSELGYVFMTADGYINYHDGGHRGRVTASTVSQATFADAGAGAGYFYTDVQPEYGHELIYNRVSVTPGYANAVPQVVEDVPSQLLYSPVTGVAVPRDYTRSTLLALDADALLVANSILAAYKDAKVRFENIRLLDRADPANWTQVVMGRELGDLVTLRTKPPGHSTVGVYDCYIEAIEEEGNPGLPIAVTFTLSLATAALSTELPGPTGGGAVKDSSGDDLVLDSATLGVLG